MKSFIQGLLLIVGSFVLNYGLTYFMAYVSTDIIKLYSIPYLINLSIGNIFGFWFVYTLFTTKRFELVEKISPKEKKKEDEFFKDDLKTQLTYTVFILLIWGLAYLTHKIFF